MASTRFLLYGANGYTGKLITALAGGYGLTPVLAGRNEQAIRTMADQYGLEYRVFDLGDKNMLEQVLNEVPLVLHAAGPFSKTAAPMIQACLKTRTHYVDITGEIEVFEMAKAKDKEAKEAGIILLPGAGFDVVPTDCMALWLKKQLPTAQNLSLAFTGSGGLSHGTAHTMIEGLGKGSAARKNGKIVATPLGHKSQWIRVGDKNFFVMTIPWGDVSTAFHTTGIPNIETYTAVPPKVYNMMKFQSLFNWLLRTELIKNLLRNKVNASPAGPSAEKRKSANSYIWGKVTDQEGRSAESTMITPDGYTLTSHSSLIIVKKILANHFSPGYHTPAGLFGVDLVMEIPGVERLS